MTATSNNEHGYKVGDVLVSEYGYSMSLVNYYQVVKTTRKMVSFRRIDDEQVCTDVYGQSGRVRPVRDRFIRDLYFGDDVITRKVNEYGSIHIMPGLYAQKWDGKDNYFDTYD